MNIDKLTKNLNLQNLKWWEDPYTFACLELSSMLNCKIIWKDKFKIKISDAYPNSTILTRDRFYKYYEFLIKVNDYIIITYIEPHVYVFYNSKFVNEESIKNLIQKIEEEF